MANGVSKMWRCQNVSVYKKLSLERRKKSYDGTHFACLQKTGRFRNNCPWLLVGKVVQYSCRVKKLRERASPSKMPEERKKQAI